MRDRKLDTVEDGEKAPEIFDIMTASRPEARFAVEQGADEIDMVITLANAVAGDMNAMVSEIVTELSAHSGGTASGETFSTSVHAHWRDSFHDPPSLRNSTPSICCGSRPGIAIVTGADTVSGRMPGSTGSRTAKDAPDC
ncbi:hypothetical protein [Corynebacterium bovis]|uniref:hypothetical protein n=1 Tax=Corynebacterium bovis TaxID=36808 RepID=UPI003CC73792